MMNYYANVIFNYSNAKIASFLVEDDPFSLKTNLNVLDS